MSVLVMFNRGLKQYNTLSKTSLLSSCDSTLMCYSSSCMLPPCQTECESIYSDSGFIAFSKNSDFFKNTGCHVLDVLKLDEIHYLIK